MDQQTFYGGGAHGYIDYPTLKQSEKSIHALEKTPT